MKIPESVLVVIHTIKLDVLLIERVDHPGFWQSVTGSLDHADESGAEACRREVCEETGIDTDQHRLSDWKIQNRYPIYPEWRHRYAPGVTTNLESVFGLTLKDRVDIRLNPNEHRDFRWMPWREAVELCFSRTNADAIRRLPDLVMTEGAGDA